MMERHSHTGFWLTIAVLAVLAAASLVAAGWLSGQLADTREQVAGVEGELAIMQTGLTGTESELAASQALVQSLDEVIANLEVNYDRLTSGYGYVLRDPTYREVMEFLAEDDTSGREYADGRYTCVDFAASVKANAAKEGIRCAYVVLEYRGGAGHAIVAFDTTDRGLVFVEPQFDWEVEPEVDRRYYQCVRPPAGYYMAAPGHDDTITRIIVIW